MSKIPFGPSNNERKRNINQDENYNDSQLIIEKSFKNYHSFSLNWIIRPGSFLIRINNDQISKDFATKPSRGEHNYNTL